MRPTRLALIFVIFLGVSVAWLILGASVMQRTQTSFDRLREQVGGLWGTPLQQAAPALTVRETFPVKVAVKDAKGRVVRTQTVSRQEDHAISPDSSDIEVALHSDARRKGLLWYRTYAVSFEATYTVKHQYARQPALLAKFFFPSNEAIYDDFLFSVNGQEAGLKGSGGGYVANSIALPPGQVATIKVRYKSRGLDTWSYGFGDGVSQVKNFRLVADTDFKRYDFPEKSLSPTEKRETAQGWELTWQFANLISGFRIGVAMPEPPNPGEMVSRISFFAPVGLLFFLTVVVIMGLMRGRNLHPMHYFFVAGGFFAFHLLMAYLADHLDLRLTFLTCAAVSVLLVLSYLVRAVGANFALRVAAPAQLIFLVVFSYAFFFKGYTGLSITLASILTLALLMHVTAKVDWESRFRTPPKA
jgi:inner membrane protein involved in colicin E2 resistance